MWGELLRCIFSYSSFVLTISFSQWCQVCGHLSASPLQNHHEGGFFFNFADWILVLFLVSMCFCTLSFCPTCPFVLTVASPTSFANLLHSWRWLAQWVSYLHQGSPPYLLTTECYLGSYVHIRASIRRVPSIKIICKTLSTCGFHLFVVFFYYGTLAVTYLFPSSYNSKVKGSTDSVIYTVVAPMLNLLIYSLRIRDMKLAGGYFIWGRLFLASKSSFSFGM